MKICLIGCGGHTRAAHMPALRERSAKIGGPQLAACCDTDISRAEAYCGEGGFERAYTDYAEMVEREVPDAIVLVTPFTITPKIASDLLMRGMPTLIEKPPAETLALCAPMVKAAEESGTMHQVAFNRRHMPLVNEATRLRAGRPIQHIDYSMYRLRRTEPHFHTTAIHGIDVVRHWAQSPYKRITFFYQDIPELGSGVSNMFMSAEFESGATARLSFVVSSGRVHERLMMSGNGYSVEAALPMWNGCDSPGFARLFESDKLTAETMGEDAPMFVTNGFLDQLKAFCICVEAKTKSPHDLKSSLQSVEISEYLARREKMYP